MEEADHVSKLLLDPAFQQVLEQWPDTDRKKRQQLLTEFGLTAKDIEEMYIIWSGTRFRKQAVPTEEIAEELTRTIWKIEETERKQNQRGFKEARFLQLFSRVAAILIVPLLVYTAYLHLKSPGITHNKEELQLITVQSQPGTLSTVVLPDGSKVWLNSGSSVSYPTHFSGKYRDVSMAGEAYFEVVKNKDFPMVVSANNFNVKVYGTKFNINSYRKSDVSRVTLVEGSISLTGRESGRSKADEILMKPGQTAAVYSRKEEVVFETADPFLYTAWKDGLIVFKNVLFDKVLERLSLKYNVKIELKDNSLRSIPLDATFKGESINEILRLMSLSIPFKFYYGEDQARQDGSFEKSTIYIVRK